MSEELLVKHCSPTLAGMKTGNLFVCSFPSDTEVKDCVCCWNRLLTKKGLRVLPLRYRIRQAQATKLLIERGCSMETSEHCIVHLIRRLCEYKEFPHEIGLFLGYPPKDVHGFIENKADAFKFVRCWKVYGDADAARKTFKKYKKCTDVYCAQFAKGRSIERLAVVG